jgi:hypothetical protein
MMFKSSFSQKDDSLEFEWNENIIKNLKNFIYIVLFKSFEMTKL